MQVSHILITAWITLMTAASVQADTLYSWKDTRGITHYTNSIHDVPERYRAKVKTLKLGNEEKSVSGQQQPAILPASPTTPAPAAAPADIPPKALQPVPAPPLPQNLFTAPEQRKEGKRPAGKKRRGSGAVRGSDE